MTAAVTPDPVTLPEIMSAKDAHDMQKQGNLTIIDVRTPREWMRTGLAQGAHTLSLQDPGFVQHLFELIGEDRSRPLAIICATGNRSAMVQRFLLENGFSAITNIAEGMMGNFHAYGWIRSGLPVTPYHR